VSPAVAQWTIYILISGVIVALKFQAVREWLATYSDIASGVSVITSEYVDRITERVRWRLLPSWILLIIGVRPLEHVVEE
jgi:hypothetical protein